MTSVNGSSTQVPTNASAQKWTTRSLEVMANDLSRLLNNKTLAEYFSRLASVTWSPMDNRYNLDNRGNGGEVDVTSGMVWTLVAPLILLVVFVSIVSLLAYIWRCRRRRSRVLDDENVFSRRAHSQDHSSTSENELSVMGEGMLGSHWNDNYNSDGEGVGLGRTTAATGVNVNQAYEEKHSRATSGGNSLLKRFRGISPDGMIHLSKSCFCWKVTPDEDGARSEATPVPVPDCDARQREFHFPGQGEEIRGQHLPHCAYFQPYKHLSTPEQLLEKFPHHHRVLVHLRTQPSSMQPHQRCHCNCRANGSQVQQFQQHGVSSSCTCTSFHHHHQGVENPLFADDESDEDRHYLNTNSITTNNLHDNNCNHLCCEKGQLFQEEAHSFCSTSDAGEATFSSDSSKDEINFSFNLGSFKDNGNYLDNKQYPQNSLRYNKSPLVEGPDVSCVKINSATTLSLRKSYRHLPSPQSLLESVSLTGSEYEKSVDSLSLPSSISRFHASRVQPLEVTLPPDAAYPSRKNPILAYLCGRRYEPHEVDFRVSDIKNGKTTGKRRDKGEVDNQTDDNISVCPNVGSSCKSCEVSLESGSGQGCGSSAGSEAGGVGVESPCPRELVNCPPRPSSAQRRLDLDGSAHNIATEGPGHACKDKKNKRSEPLGRVWWGRNGSESYSPTLSTSDLPASAAELKRRRMTPAPSGKTNLRDDPQIKQRSNKSSHRCGKVYSRQKSFSDSTQTCSSNTPDHKEDVIFQPVHCRKSREMEKIYCSQQSQYKISNPDNQDPLQHWVSPLIASGYKQAPGQSSETIWSNPLKTMTHRIVQPKRYSHHDGSFKQQERNPWNRSPPCGLRFDQSLSGTRRTSDFFNIKPTILSVQTPQSDCPVQAARKKRRTDWTYPTVNGPSRLSFGGATLENQSRNTCQKPTPRDTTRPHYERSFFGGMIHEGSLKQKFGQQQIRKSVRHSDEARANLNSSQFSFPKTKHRPSLQEYAWDYTYLNVGSSFQDEVLPTNPKEVVLGQSIFENNDQAGPGLLLSNKGVTLNNLATNSQESTRGERKDDLLHPVISDSDKRWNKSSTGNGSARVSPPEQPLSGDEVFGMWNASPELGSDVSCPRAALMTPLNDEAKRAVIKFMWGDTNPSSLASSASTLVPTWKTSEAEKMETAWNCPQPGFQQKILEKGKETSSRDKEDDGESEKGQGSEQTLRKGGFLRPGKGASYFFNLGAQNKMASMSSSPATLDSGLDCWKLYNISNSGGDNGNNASNTTIDGDGEEDASDGSCSSKRRQLQLSPTATNPDDRNLPLDTDISSTPSTRVLHLKEYWL